MHLEIMTLHAFGNNDTSLIVIYPIGIQIREVPLYVPYTVIASERSERADLYSHVKGPISLYTGAAYRKKNTRNSNFAMRVNFITRAHIIFHAAALARNNALVLVCLIYRCKTGCWYW